MGFKLYYFVLVVSLIGSSSAISQVGDPRFNNVPTTQSQVSDTLEELPALKYLYSLSGAPEAIFEFSDTTLGNGFMFVDPSRRQSEEYLHLGYPGSSVSALSFSSVSERGFHMGYRQYDIYKQNIDSLRLYRANRTIADLSFYQLSGNQNNLNANADYSQNFKDDISMSVNFKRYNFESQYANLSNRSTSFGIGFTFDPESKPYSSYLAFLSNTNNESNNGGITDYNQLIGDFSTFRSNASVALQNAQNRHDEKTVRWFFNRDLLQENLSMSYDVSYNWGNYFYYDRGNLDASDSLVYKDYIKDDRGLRYLVTTSNFSNGLYIDASFSKFLNLNLGMVYDRIGIYDGLNEYNRNDISLVYKGEVLPNDKISIDVNGHLGLGSNAGNFLVDAATILNWGKYFVINAGWRSYLNEPSLVQSRVVLNNVSVYDNDYTKILGTQLRAFLSIPSIGISAAVTQDIENNTIYWDRDALPKQYDDVFTASKFTIATNHRIWKFGIVNKGIYQLFNDNLFNLPDWYTTHNLYFESPMFKRNLLLRIGTNARVIPSGLVQNFNPVVGQFYQGDYNPILYPEWGFYISGKISRFRIILEYENITNWFTDEVNFNIQDYPYNDSNLRFGVRWLLLD